MAANYNLLAVCLLLMQVPRFLTKPQEINGDAKRWAQPRPDVGYSLSQKPVNYKVTDKEPVPDKTLKEVVALLDSLLNKNPTRESEDERIGYSYYLEPDLL